MMNKTIAILMMFGFVTGLSSAVLVDDFDAYAPGAVETVTTNWKGINAQIQVDPADSTNQMLLGFQSGGQSCTYGIFSTDASIAEGQTKTLFFRFRVNSATTDQALGLTDVDAPATSDGNWGNFRVAVRVTNGVFGIRNGGSWIEGTDGVDRITVNVGETQPWYNCWIVVTNGVGATTATDNFKVYLHQDGTEDAMESDRVSLGGADTFGFRTAVTTTLDRFIWGRQGGGDETDIRRIWIDSMHVVNGESLINPAVTSRAYNPSPANGAEYVPLDAVLTWNTGLDPANHAQANPAITHHYVYFRANDPNFSAGDLVETITPAGTGGSFDPELTTDMTYYWRVDEGINNLPATDANTIEGSIWSFSSVHSAPVITGQPQDAVARTGQSATFTVTFTSINPIESVMWKKSDGTTVTEITPTSGKYAVSSDEGTTTLTISDVQSDDQGWYFCTLNNGGTTDSQQARLGEGRLMAHWTLDQASYAGGQYVDATGNHPADPNGVPVFVSGADEGQLGAVEIGSSGGSADAGTWNPSEHTGQFTVSLWAKWAGQTTPTTWQGLVSKEVSYGVDTMMWQYEVTQADQASSTVVLKNGLETGNLSTAVLPVDAWEHIAITWDGTTATIYRNGVSAASGAWTPGSKTDAPLNIGCSANPHAFTFNGALDDVQIHSWAMTNEDVVDLLYHPMKGDSACIHFSSESEAFDLNNNCKIDIGDIVTLAADWLDCGLFPVEACL